MKKIIIENLDVNNSLFLVNELKQNGFVMGIDFDWSYHKPIYNENTYELVCPKQTIFYFYKDITATWFSLRYQ